MLGATQAGLAFSNSFGRAGARHVAADRRAFPRAARPVERDAAAGDHALLRRPPRRRATPRRRGRSASRSPTTPTSAPRARLVAGLEALNRDLGVPTPAAFGIDEATGRDKLPLMAQQALASGSPANNPRVPDAKEIVALYNEVWTGAARNTRA